MNGSAQNKPPFPQQGLTPQNHGITETLKGLPRQPSLKRGRLARLVWVGVGIFLTLWVLFWLNYFEIIYLGEQFPFLPSKSPGVGTVIDNSALQQ